jgi:hypothetical protein
MIPTRRSRAPPRAEEAFVSDEEMDQIMTDTDLVVVVADPRSSQNANRG